MMALRVCPWSLWPVRMVAKVQGNCVSFTVKRAPLTPNVHLNGLLIVTTGKQPGGRDSKLVVDFYSANWWRKSRQTISSAYTV